jgi:hypothetical protein
MVSMVWGLGRTCHIYALIEVNSPYSPKVRFWEVVGSSDVCEQFRANDGLPGSYSVTLASQPCIEAYQRLSD